MREFKDLTYRGKLRRYRWVAQAALDAYGLGEAHLRFIRDNGNTVYRVKAKDPTPVDESLYVKDCYALRLHWTGYHEEAAVESELEWLAALSDEGLPVPQPLRTLEGKLTAKVAVPGVPGVRQCSIIRWVKGRQATKGVRPWHLTAIGRLIAQLHDHASRWNPPKGFTRRHYDTNGLWGDDTGTGYTAKEVWPDIPKQYFTDFEEITRRVQQVMDAWGKGPDVFGLIHADLGTKANVFFHKGGAHAI
ncbi:MAG: phosphotransferase enzyme family protein, partial [Promethearchaeota archaeon]